jgi:hypothetical protein
MVERLAPAAGGAALTAGGADVVDRTFFLPADAVQLVDPTAPAGAAERYRVRAYNAAGTSAAAEATAVVAAPQLVSVAVNGGGAAAAQRSQVRSVTVAFDRPVTLGAGAVTLARLNAGGSGANDGSAPTDVSAGLTLATADGGLTWAVSFAAGGSLADGAYVLTVRADRVADAAANAVGGGDRTYAFHRLFGDADGNRSVNTLDFNAFRKALGSTIGQPGYQAALDYDGNGSVNTLDFNQFKARLGRSLTF